MHNAFIHPRTFNDIRRRSRGYLPHWELDGAIYSVTFRLADSLPRHVFESLRDERRAIVAGIAGEGRQPTMFERMEIDRRFGIRLDERLDAAHGRCELRRAELATIVAGALTHFGRDRYELTAWCVMPNHVHVVVMPAPGWKLETILQSWKSYSAKRINSMLGRRGQFWQREYFDRLIRDREDYLGAARYVLENPEKAGLRNWPFVWCDPEIGI